MLLIKTLWSEVNPGSDVFDGKLPIFALVLIGIAIFLFVFTLSFVILNKIEKEKERKALEASVKEEIEREKSGN